MSWWSWAQEALFPPRCIICKREGSWLCKKHNAFPSAPKNEASFENLDNIFAATAYYHPTTRTFVEYFKFRGFRDLADIMAKQIVLTLPPEYLKTHTLIPVPLHWTRKLWRGFNQAEILAQAIQRYSPETPVQGDLKRIRRTKQQAKLKRSDRLQNLTLAFEWRGKEIPKKILLIDDVVASGSTLDSAAKILKRNGAKNVSGVVFARGGKPCQNSGNET
jgi:ComF family protein